MELKSKVFLLQHGLCWILFSLIETTLSTSPHDPNRIHFPECPPGAQVLQSRQGLPQKCLPHQLQVCYEAANRTALLPADENQPLCCWHNKIDYYCCRGVAPDNCPTYDDVTIVIHKGIPRPPARRLYAFRKIIPLYRSPIAGEQFVARQPLASGLGSRRVVAPPPPFHRHTAHTRQNGGSEGGQPLIYEAHVNPNRGRFHNTNRASDQRAN